jgi:hypothetical protein
MDLSTFGLPRHGAGPRITILLVILGLMSVACWLGWRVDVHLSDENHLMENTQAVCLCLAWWVHGWRAWHTDRSKVAYTFHIGLSLLMYSFMLRELDISEIDATGEIAWTWTEHILRGIGWTCWVFFFIHFFRRFGRIWRLRWKIMATPVMIATLVGGVLMSCGWPFDKKKFDSLSEDTSQFIEELLELNAYVFLLVASASDSLQETESEPDTRKTP